MDLTELNERGWTFVDGVSSQADLLELGKALGCPVRTPNGDLVKEIRRIPRDEAPPGSQSALYGAGPFLLHTDTVFWPLPVRYVLLRGYGDTRRPTTVKRFYELVRECDTQFHVCARDSVWLVSAGPKKFYCSIKFRHGDSSGWRYDADLMAPANDAAVHIERVLRPLVSGEAVDQQLFESSKRTSVTNLHLVKIREMRIAFPRFDEQGTIVAFLDTKCAELEKLKENIQQQISTLEQYRKSLIHECVTGKRRITENDAQDQL